MSTSVWRDGALLLTWCVIIFAISHQPSVPMPLSFPYADKLNHFIAYGVMGWLAWNAFGHRCRGVELFTLVIIFCSLYGVSDEYHQSFIEGRFSEVGDWVADTAGGAVSAIVRWRVSLNRATT